jgi:hypothetical protein
MSFETRAAKLERLLTKRSGAASPSEGYQHPAWRRDLFAIFDEFSSLRSSQAVHHRGGVRIEPVDLPRKLLGENYTREELWELAIARGLEKRGYSTQEIAELLPVWIQRLSSEAEDPRGGYVVDGSMCRYKARWRAVRCGSWAGPKPLLCP